ncbi:hypothetical protein [Streptomyces sp. NPDC057677]|uniref:hypothetical protein n=1 Tax=unclassified Streptomyces TaxID=2593676 RepID=UPI0036D1E2E6
MTHVPSGIDVASLRTHRLILLVDNDGIAQTRSNLSRPDVANILHTLADGIAPANSETTCLDELFTGRPCPHHAATDETDLTTADDPTPLRWGLGDVIHSNVEQERQAARAEEAVARVLAWCDDLDTSIRQQHGDPHAEHPHATALRLIIDPQEGP